METDLVQRLPDNVSFLDIAREIEMLAGIKAAREQARRGEGTAAEEAGRLLDAWVSK